MKPLKLAVLACLALSLVFMMGIAISAVSENTITLSLVYGEGTPWDPDNNGVTDSGSVIDFSVNKTLFSWAVNESKLATRWEVYSLDDQTVTTVCYGNLATCNYLGLPRILDEWDDPLNLYPGLHNATSNNMVGARVVFLDAGHSDPVVVSDWVNLSATFVSGVIGTQSGNVTVTVVSPINDTDLVSGENIVLNVSASQTISLNYTLDHATVVALGEGLLFSSALVGGLDFGTLTNGVHNITLRVNDGGDSTVFEHRFRVNDSAAPVLIVNITNNTLLIGDAVQKILFSTDEYASVNVSVNGGTTSSFDLGPDKNEVINITFEDGGNLLSIATLDLQGNSKLYEYVVEFSETGSCSDSRQNGNETGIDCGGSCPVCVPFNVTVDRDAYNVSDVVLLEVLARANSSVDIAITRPGSVVYSSTVNPVFEGAPIFETRAITGIDEAATYTVLATMFYLNITESISFDFEVVPPPVNPLDVTIVANATTIDEGEVVKFSVELAGSTTSPSYAWDFNNDGTVDTTESAPAHSFGNNGTYVVNLTVETDLWNATDTLNIVVRKLYNVTIIVQDNLTEEVIEGAKVTLGELERNSTDEGRTAFTINKDVHRLRISKEGYGAYSNDTNINGNFELTIQLSQIDESGPGVDLLSPDNDFIFDNEGVILTYKVTESGTATCSLFLNHNEEGFALQSTQNDVIDDTSFDLGILDDGVYSWKIECFDEHGNRNSSAPRFFSVELTSEEVVAEENLDESTIQDSVSRIDDALAQLTELNDDEKDAADALQLSRWLERSKTALQRANRDINNIGFRKLEAEEENELLKEIKDKIREVEDTTPVELKVLEQAEFVKYPDKKAVENATSVYLEYNSIKLTSKQRRDLVETNVELQSSINIRTRAKIVELTSISGKKRIITVLHKTVTSEGELDGHTFFEIIPKSLAENLEEVELLFEYNVVEEDPIVEIDIIEVPDFVYYIKKRLSLDDTQDTKSVLLTSDVDSRQKRRITGFAALDSFSEFLLHSSKTRLLIEILVILILIGVYVVYSFGTPSSLMHELHKKFSKEMRIIEEKIEIAEEQLSKKFYDEAKSLYGSIGKLFKELPPKDRKDLYAKIAELGNKIDVAFINKLLDEGFEMVTHGRKLVASKKYPKIAHIYKRIAPAYKAEVLKRCVELKKKLDEEGW